MSTPYLSPRRRLGSSALLGMIGIILAVEGYVSWRSLDFTSPLAAFFAFPYQVCAEARGAEVLCFGDSIAKTGLVPRVFEARLGDRAYNLAIAGAMPQSTYLTLRRALEEGVRPSAIVVDFHESTLRGDPREQIPLLMESVTLGDCLDLAGTWRDASSLGLILTGRFLPSFRCRSEIRSNILAALRGEASRTRQEVLTYQRNWRMNQGAHIFPPDGSTDSIPVFWDELAHLQTVWCCDPQNGKFLIKFLKLAEAREIPVYWIVPPINPRVQVRRDQLGLDDLYTRFVHRVMDRFPTLTVIDGRRAGFGKERFVDAGHFDRGGAVALTAGVAEVIARDRAGKARGPRWVDLPRISPLSRDIAIEDIVQSGLALSKIPEARR